MVVTAEDRQHLCAALQDALAPFVVALGDLAARVGALESPDARLVAALREIAEHHREPCHHDGPAECMLWAMLAACRALAAYQGQTGGSERA